MNSDAEVTQRLRINLLRQCKAAGIFGLTVSALIVAARLEAFEVDEKRVGEECDHLADPDLRLLRLVDEKFSRAVKRYKITSEGREWLEEHGF
jgi:hypothetical protein